MIVKILMNVFMFQKRLILIFIFCAANFVFCSERLCCSINSTLYSIDTLSSSRSKVTKKNYRSARFSLPSRIMVPSLLDEDCGIFIQGIIDNYNNRISIRVPYTSSGRGNYSAYKSASIPVVGEDGDINSISISYPAGFFSTEGAIVVRLQVEDRSKVFKVQKLSVGEQKLIAKLPFVVNEKLVGYLHLYAIGGIPDRNYGSTTLQGTKEGIMGQYHDFIYLPIRAEDGKVWLNHNLGANYTNVNHDSFNPRARPNSVSDFNAYGSLFQWGRQSDGHELRNESYSYNDVTTQLSFSPAPMSRLFIVNSSMAPYNWCVSDSSGLWQVGGGVYDPCPQGFRLPTKEEFNGLISRYGYTSADTVFRKDLGFTFAGHREPFDGAIDATGVSGKYWTSSSYLESGTSSSISWYPNNVITGPSYRAYGFCVRCIMK